MLTTCPTASVFAPPAVNEIAPAVEIVPARFEAVPPAVDVTSEKFGTSPTVGADPAKASA